LAGEEFREFYDLIGKQILRFAREEYTPTHIRVLTALMAMEAPPGTIQGAGAIVGDPNAGTKGQMDTEDTSIERFRGFSSARGTFAINVVTLPPEIVDEHLRKMEEWNNPSEEYRDLLLIELVEQLKDHLRDDLVDTWQRNPDLRAKRGTQRNPADFLPFVRSELSRYRLRSLDEASVARWITDFSFSGRAATVQRYFKRVALDLALSRLEQIKREEVQTRILLDHLNHDIIATFGGDEAAPVTPADVEGRSVEEWLGVLASHSQYPEPIPDRPGVVNPIAVCGVTERLSALDEASFKPINVDSIVVGRASLTRVEELLWEVRHQAPFQFIDDPERNKPEVSRLVTLPGDRAIYRIRWRVWAGWHLLWGAEPVGEGGEGPDRLALRTSALCDDLVLSSPDLVPTLLRGALLDGEFRPAIPVRETGKTMRPEREKNNDDVVIDVNQTEQAAENSERDVRTGVDAVNGSADAQLEIARELIGGLSSIRAPTKKLRGVDTTPVDSEAVRYLQGLFLEPLRRLRGDRPVMVMAFDHGYPSVEREKIWDWKPRTPYNQAQRSFFADVDADRRKDQIRYLRTAAWSLGLEKTDKGTPTTMLSPAYLPTELLSTAELKQEWKRRSSSDWNFGGGLGFFPYRFVQYSCNPDAQGGVGSGSAVNCAAPGTTPVARNAETQGISLDLFALNTRWLVADRRMAIEFGPELHIDLVNAGRSPFYDGDRADTGVRDPATGEDLAQRTQYNWSTRFTAGVVVGMRFAPDAGPLWRSNARRYPWGAPLPDGTSLLSRVQYGFRVGLLLGPTYDGLETQALAEGWVGWALRSKRGPQASFTPYHTATLLGPFVRFQAGFPLVQNPSRYYAFDQGMMVILGIRAQLRLTAQPEIKLEAPK
jgi:hypothetical protein